MVKVKVYLVQPFLDLHLLEVSNSKLCSFQQFSLSSALWLDTSSHGKCTLFADRVELFLLGRSPNMVFLGLFYC